ncbi:MAG: folate-binding protein [Methylophilaceae bacterium]
MTETNWQTHLTSQGAVLQGGNVQHFGDALSELKATASNNTLCDLSHLGLLTLSGEDATTFLQGQVTNDVAQLNGNNVHYSAYCSPKGRMLALFLAFSYQNKLYLQFNQSILTSIMKRLKMYVMRAKVDINDVSNDLLKFGVNGPGATNIIKQALGKTPEQDYAMVATENIVVIKLPSLNDHNRYEILVDSKQASDLWSTLKGQCTPVGKPCWDWLEIQTGTPDVLEKTQEQFVPQMLNLDILNGINFKKGCYTGQEIVARTHYLGVVKRRTYLASIATNEQPTEGDRVTDNAKSEVGQLVKVTPNTQNGFDALIEIRIEAKQAGNISWRSYPVTFSRLPYSFNE